MGPGDVVYVDEPIGLIAGAGRLPVLVAEGVGASGRTVACVGLHDHFDHQLVELCSQLKTAGFAQLGRWIRLLRMWNVSEAIMVGRVRKTRMYEPFRLFRQLPDWRAARVWYRTARHDKRTNALLSAVADELQRCGITLLDVTRYISQHVAEPGVMTCTQPTSAHETDIAFGLPVVQRLGATDIGQALAVHAPQIIAIEAIEGTDAMIHRAGKLGRGGWTLMKTARPNQDMRFDVPTVGLNTIENLKSSGATCLAVEAGKVILLDKPHLLETADRAGVVVVGVTI